MEKINKESVESKINALCDYAIANNKVFVFAGDVYDFKCQFTAKDAMLFNYEDEMENRGLTEDEIIEEYKSCMVDEQEDGK